MVKSRCFAARLRRLIAVCLLFVCAAIEVEAKQIRLRSGAIPTSPPAKAPGLAVNQTNDGPVDSQRQGLTQEQNPSFCSIAPSSDHSNFENCTTVRRSWLDMTCLPV
jgi:hypothetical protein